MILRPFWSQIDGNQVSPHCSALVPGVVIVTRFRGDPELVSGYLEIYLKKKVAKTFLNNLL